MIKRLKKIIFIKENTITKNNLSIAIEYNNLGSAYYNIDNHKEALAYHNKALKIRKSKLGKDDINTAISYSNIGAVYHAIDNDTKALSYYKKSLQINKNILGEKHLYVARDYNNIALVYKQKGFYKKALKYLLQSLTIYSELLNNDDIKIAIISNNISTIYQDIGEYDKALKYSEKALDIYEKNSIENSDVGVVYHSLGLIYQSIGDYRKAIKNYKKALNIYKKILNNKHSMVAMSYNNIGTVYDLLGDAKRALKYYNKALSIYKVTLGKSHSKVAVLYNNIGSVYISEENYSKALKNYQMSLELYKNRPDVDYLGISTTYDNLGALFESIKDYNKSLSFHQESLQLNRAILGEENIEVATNYNNLGLLYSSLNNHQKALKFHTKSLELSKKLLGKENIDTATSYYNMGLEYKSLKNYNKAYQYINLFFNIFIKNRDNHFSILDKQQKFKYIKRNIKIGTLLETAQLYQANLKDWNHKRTVAKKLINSWLKYKGTLFEYQNILTMIESKTKDETVKEDIKNLRDSTKKLAHLENKQTKDPLNPNKYKNQIASIQEKRGKIQISLSEKNIKFKELLGLKDINSTQISSKLEESQLYIDFARTDKNYYLFTLDSQNNVTFEQIDENRTKEIDKAIQLFRANNSKIAKNINNGALIESLKKDSQEILEKLYMLLFNGVIDKQFTKLTISPDGLLNFLPFEALYYNGKYLIEEYLVKYISSGREFIRQTKREQSNQATDIVVFGTANFEYGVKSSNDIFISPLIEGNFKKLDSSKEINILKQYYRDVIVYENNESTVANLMRVINPKILHISTHGFFHDEQNITNPMRRSGLALVGANMARVSGDMSGIVTALELSTLELTDTELAILSACETGLGTIQKAEGVVGLQKAFIQAGAKNVMMSLWIVSDNATAKLMEYFYAYVAKGEDYATALRTAKLKMIDEHPFYWSAFIMSGI